MCIRDSLSLCHCNIRGLSLKKLSDIETSLCTYDIITVSETYLSANSKVNLDLKGYHPVIRRDRATLGGGLAIYIKENIIFKRKVAFESNRIETLWIEVNTLQGKLLICNTYRPPSAAEFWENLSYDFEHVKTESPVQNMVLLGDLNADFSTVNGNKLIEFCRTYNLECHISEPTRITQTSQTCLDQIISNIPNFISSVSVEHPVSTNDHCTVGVDLKFRIQNDPAYYRHIWLYDKADSDGFKSGLNSTNWDDCFLTNDVDIACDMWSNTFLNISRMYIPNKLVLVRPKDSPWYSNELRKMKRKLIRLYRKAKDMQSDYHWRNYKDFNRMYHDSLNEAEEQYNNDMCESLKQCGTTSRWWRTVKHVLGKGNNQSYPPVKDDNGTHATSSNDKAKLFNEYFLSHCKIDDSNARLPPANDAPAFTLDHINVSEDEVFDLISTLDVNKSTGHDGISARMLKLAGATISPSLTKLFKLCLSANRFPNVWKKADVIPLYKKGDKDMCSNYRPVSILPVLSKILERIVFKNVYNFFLDHKLISIHQSGFRPNDSTVNQMAFCTIHFAKP